MATVDKDGNVNFAIEELAPPESIDYFTYRLDIAREQKHTSWWRIAAIIVFAAFIITNWYWVYWRNQHIEESYTSEATTDGGGTAVANATGEVTVYGYGESDNQEAGS